MRWVRYLYNSLLCLALPFIFLRLLWRARLSLGYLDRLPQRFGYYHFTLDECLWVHAVSLGETIVAIPLIQALKLHYPHLPIVVTTMTKTGADHIKKSLGEGVIHAYLPYDFPFAMKWFLRAIRPRIGIIVETELWPNLLFTCQKLGIPLCLLNARLSERSAVRYAKIRPMMQAMLACFTKIGAQTKADAARFLALGALPSQVDVTGNMKFDLSVPDDVLHKSSELRSYLGKDRFIWIAASTHEQEEEWVLDAHEALLKRNSNALLIIVPRHPERFDRVASLIKKRQLKMQRRSHLEATFEAEVYLGDTMGELLLLYATADVAFVGGSFIAHGGQNLLEPAALQKPILSGQYLFNFDEVKKLLLSADALTIVFPGKSLMSALEKLMCSPALRQEMGGRAHQVIETNRGALIKQMEIVKKIYY